MLEILKNIVPKERIAKVIWLCIILLAFFAGWIMSNGGGNQKIEALDHDKDESATTWTCSMHPQIQQPASGQCPICGMDLIPVTSQRSNDLSFREISLSDRARRLANIQVATVDRKFVSTEIRMVGKVDYDETRLGYITARVPGRIDRMYVDYTGITVRKGDHLVELYSPELVSTQQELIQSLKYSGESDSKIMQQNVASIRERLRLWGLTSTQIKNIENSNQVTDHVTIYAPMGGIVIHRDGVEGMYVNTGTRIYTIADLSRVWIQLDAYESDVSWLRYGQNVEFRTETYPGEVFKGKIAFIDPVLNDKTRTIKVRMNVDNKDGKLKPGMFVRAIAESKIAGGGKVMDPSLTGKWISPMHPEIVKDGPGSCDVCGMKLVRAEELGYISAEDIKKEAPIVIPASAPLITGKRSVVYVQVPGKEGVYEGRNVVLGPRAGDYYIVKEGLSEGEVVVVNGNFKIDSAIQILAKPSMMNPDGGVAAPAHSHGERKDNAGQFINHKIEEDFEITFNVSNDFLRKLDPVYTEYFNIQNALSHDKLTDANKSATKLLKSVEKLAHQQLDGKENELWMKYLIELENSGDGIEKAETIEAARMSFEKLSNVMIKIAQQVGSSGNQPVLLYHCPMAFEYKGANWLQNKEGTENPYFGSQMFTCGTQESIITPGNPEKSGDHQHE